MRGVGEPAPDFTAHDDEGNPVTLSELRGRPVVLHFFVMAWTGVCANELAKLGEVAPRLREEGAEVLGVSCDSRFTLAAWKQAMRYDLRLVSDFWPHGGIGQRYGVFDDELGLDSRATFIVDAAGTVAEVIAVPELGRSRDVDAYLTAVRELGLASRARDRPRRARG